VNLKATATNSQTLWLVQTFLPATASRHSTAANCTVIGTNLSTGDSKQTLDGCQLHCDWYKPFYQRQQADTQRLPTALWCLQWSSTSEWAAAAADHHRPSLMWCWSNQRELSSDQQHQAPVEGLQQTEHPVHKCAQCIQYLPSTMYTEMHIIFTQYLQMLKAPLDNRFAQVCMT